MVSFGFIAYPHLNINQKEIVTDNTTDKNRER